MISAFGIDHGISKAYKKVEGRMYSAHMKLQHPLHPSDVPLNERLRWHAVAARRDAGNIGRAKNTGEARRMASMPNSFITQKSPKDYKKASQQLYDTIGRMGRAKRVLP